MKDICNRYELENRGKWNKMSCAQFQSGLQVNYPNLYDILTEQHINISMSAS